MLSNGLMVLFIMGEGFAMFVKNLDVEVDEA